MTNDKGVVWYFCPWCRNNPPDNMVNPGDNFAGGFHCFSCTAACPLARKVCFNIIIQSIKFC